jgi:secreted PhoX family phosphatase
MLTREGTTFSFAENNIELFGELGHRGDFRENEWAGVCFSPDGKWLFVNIQTPGITFAITGPWERLQI